MSIVTAKAYNQKTILPFSRKSVVSGTRATKVFRKKALLLK